MRPSSTLLMLVLRGQTLHASAYLNPQLLDDSLVEVDIVQMTRGAALIDPVRIVFQPLPFVVREPVEATHQLGQAHGSIGTCEGPRASTTVFFVFFIENRFSGNDVLHALWRGAVLHAAGVWRAPRPASLGNLQHFNGQVRYRATEGHAAGPAHSRFNALAPLLSCLPSQCCSPTRKRSPAPPSGGGLIRSIMRRTLVIAPRADDATPLCRRR